MKEAKALATLIGLRLEERGIKLRRSHLLNVVAALYGLPNWNTLAARPQIPRLEQEKALQALHSKLREYGVKDEVLSNLSKWSLSYLEGKTRVETTWDQKTADLGKGQVTDDEYLLLQHDPESGQPLNDKTEIFEFSRCIKHPPTEISQEWTEQKKPPSIFLPEEIIDAAGKGRERTSPLPGNHGVSLENALSRPAATKLTGNERTENRHQHLPVADPRKFHVGQRLSAYPDGRHSFIVQRVMRGRGITELITNQGLPLKVEGDLYIVG